MLVALNEHDNSIKQIIQLETHSVEINYFQFFKYSLFVQGEYKRGEVEKTLPNEIRNLQKRYHLKDETIIIFFKIINEENIQITNDQYYDLFILAKHFRVESLLKILDNFANKDMDDITFLITSILDKQCLCGLNNDHITEFQIDLEDKLSRKINDCLQNEHFSNLSFPTIYRIVARSSRKQIDSNILYQFISKSLEKRYMLFSFLQLDLLNSDNFTNLCSQYEKLKGSKSESIFRFLPPSLGYIAQVKSQLQQSNSKEISQLRNEITQLTNENHKLHEEIIELKKRIPKKIEKLQPIVKKVLPKSQETSTQEEGNLTQTIPVQKQINVNVIKEILSMYQQTGSSSAKPLLHIGCELGNIQLIEYIFSLGNININRIYNENGISKSALHIAIEKNCVPIVKFLLGQPNIDVNADYTIQKNGTTTTKKAIHLAVECNNVEIVGLLLNYKKIEVNNMLTIQKNNDIDSKAALHIAAEKKYIDIVQQLLTHPMIDVNIASSITINFSGTKQETTKIRKPALYIAVEVNCIEIVQLLLDHPKIDINSKFSTSVDNEYEGFINYKPNIRETLSLEKTALHVATENCFTEIVEYLLANPKIDPNIVLSETKSTSCEPFDNEYDTENTSTKRKETALFIAVKQRNLNMIQLILSSENINPNSLSEYESNSSTSNNSISTSIRTGWQKSPLHLAIEEKQISVIQYLLSHPMIDVNIKCQNISSTNQNIQIMKKTSLFLAIERHSIDIVQLLLQNEKIDLDMLSQISGSRFGKQEETALFLAVKKQNLDIVQLLLNNPQIDVNLGSKGKVKQTPLHKAIENHNINIINELLKNEKIDIKIRDVSGKTPIQLMNPSEISTFLSLLNQ